MAPVIRALREYPDRITPLLCVTAQHRDLLDQVLESFALKPDYDLDLMRPGQDLAGLTARVVTGMSELLRRLKPGAILVHGDTTTSFAAALAAFYEGVDVGHVEAGLRTRNLSAPFPEEGNRQLTARLSRWHFAPTAAARERLLEESVPADRIYVTGNTVIDALLWTAEQVSRKAPEDILGQYPELARKLAQDNPLVLITAHRRESFGAGFERICEALSQIAIAHPDAQLVYPVHPNPNVRGPVEKALRKYSNLHLIAPMIYPEFVWMMSRSQLIITDSGGIQEEAPSLRKPVLVVREVTERPEVLDSGWVSLVGTDIDRIVSAAHAVLTQQWQAPVSHSSGSVGDGHASQRIASALLQTL